MKYVVNRVRLKYLSRHPLSISLYGYDLEPGFIKSIRQHGILSPIQVTQDFIIVDGHRRYQAALEVGITETHVLVRLDLDDDLAVQEALIECNQHRDRSEEIKHHEDQVRATIAQERRKERLQVIGRQEALDAEMIPTCEPHQFSKYQWHTLDDFK